MNSSKIISISPDMSIAGCLLYSLSGSHKRYISTGYLKDRAIPLMPLFCHVPTTLLDINFRLKPYTRGFNSITDLLHMVSVRGVRTAELLPFINEEKAFAGIGEGIRHFFNGRTNQAAASLLNKDTLIVSVIGLLISASVAPAYIFFRTDQYVHRKIHYDKETPFLTFVLL